MAEQIITNCRLPHSDPAARFTVRTDSEGTITQVEPTTPQNPPGIDVEGALLAPAFVNGHLHLDKVHTLERIGDGAISAYHAQGMGGAMTAIELASAVKRDYDRAWLVPNIRRALDQAVRHGNTVIRAFADVDTTAGLEGLMAVLEAREEYRDRVDVQVVAFPQDGLLRDPGAAELIEEALKLGADCVGGIPWIEFTDEDARQHVTDMFDLAERYDRPVSMLVDDAGDAGLRTTELLAVESLRRGMQGRVTAQHARAMAMYPEPYFRKLAALLQRAGVSVVSDPHTGPLHARVRDLRAAGVTVALGQDDISDAYYPFGRNNMLEVAFLAAHTLWMTSTADLQALFDMVTVDAARALGLLDWRIEAGNSPDLVLLDAPDVRNALMHHEAPRAVLRHGKVIAGSVATHR